MEVKMKFIEKFSKNHCVKHTKVRVFSDPCIPQILSLYRDIRVREDPYSGIIYVVNDDSDVTNFSDIAGDIKIDTVKRNGKIKSQ